MNLNQDKNSEIKSKHSTKLLERKINGDKMNT